MSRVEMELPATPARLFELLEDPRSLRTLVVGARRIRRFDPRWPEVGSTLHHTIGWGPLVVRDTTEVLDCVPGRRLVLQARIRWFGTFVVSFDLAPGLAGGTRLAIEEEPREGLVSLPVVRQAVEAGIRIRNAELGRRLQRLSDHRDEALRGGPLA